MQTTEATSSKRIETAAQAATKAKKATVNRQDLATVAAQNLSLLAQRHQDALAQAKKLYEEADGILAQILAAAPVGTVIPLPDGRKAKVEDNFIDAHGNPKNTAFRPCGVKRFDLKVK